jgi:hypothetical protein
MKAKTRDGGVLRIRQFLLSELPSLFIWASIGAVCAALLHLCLQDHNFSLYLVHQFADRAKNFDAPKTYLAYGVTIAATALLILALRLPSLIKRGLKSWWAGVTSGLRFLSALLTFTFLALPLGSFTTRLYAYLVSLVVATAVAIIHHERARAYRLRTLTEKDIQVSIETKRTVGTRATQSDDPIETWAEDTLGRAALVDSLSIKLLISKAPVIALFGDFGSGKTSLLNLLREHLTGKAIIVSFSTWLPGSQETLTSYLLSDIASECQKEYIVPGLRSSARSIADALSETVPALKGFLRLFPVNTQKDDIENLKSALSRLPKRVVVLLDELDRMERAELLSLLKVVRGIASLPNVSFVCAAERKKLTQTVCEENDDDANLYFEKFFPSSVQIPKADPQALQNAGIERLIFALRSRQWFKDEAEITQYRENLGKIWPNRVAYWVRNLRAIGLLANDVSVAAAPLRRQVDAVDLTLLEMLRRFKPTVYDIVSRNGVALTGGESIIRGGSYHTDGELKQVRERLDAELAAAAEGDEQAGQIKGLISELFPDYAKRQSSSWILRPKLADRDETDQRVRHPGMFPAYFRYDVPEALYSAVEFEDFADKSKAAKNSQERQKLFSDELLSMPKGSLKRDDFLRKVADNIEKESVDIGRDWIHAILAHANELTYDSMIAFGEAGHALRMIIRVALKLPKSELVPFLEQCIMESVDDTLPFRILSGLPGSHQDFALDVTFEELYPSFLRRMRGRYGQAVNAAAVDLSMSDPRAFEIWAMESSPKYKIVPDPQDRAMQREFWVRYIGNDRSRLVHVFDNFLLPNAIYQMPTEPFVEAKISMADLRRLAEAIPKLPEPDVNTRRMEAKLRNFLRGDYANGVGMMGFDNLDEPEETSDQSNDSTE